MSAANVALLGGLSKPFFVYLYGPWSLTALRSYASSTCIALLLLRMPSTHVVRSGALRPSLTQDVSFPA